MMRVVCSLCRHIFDVAEEAPTPCPRCGEHDFVPLEEA